MRDWNKKKTAVQGLTKQAITEKIDKLVVPQKLGTFKKESTLDAVNRTLYVMANDAMHSKIAAAESNAKLVEREKTIKANAPQLDIALNLNRVIKSGSVKNMKKITEKLTELTAQVNEKRTIHVSKNNTKSNDLDHDLGM